MPLQFGADHRMYFACNDLPEGAGTGAASYAGSRLTPDQKLTLKRARGRKIVALEKKVQYVFAKKSEAIQRRRRSRPAGSMEALEGDMR